VHLKLFNILAILALSVVPASAEISLENQKLIATGIPTYENRQFIARIKKDLRLNVPVIVLLGPYDKKMGSARLVDGFPRNYYILVDKDFYRGLSDLEKRSLIGHELGHVVFAVKPKAGDSEFVSLQIGADLFAARYVGFDAMIALLNKLYPTDTSKEIPEYVLRIGILKKLQAQ